MLSFYYNLLGVFRSKFPNLNIIKTYNVMNTSEIETKINDTSQAHLFFWEETQLNPGN